METRVIAVALQAGGVGKTTVSLNLASLLADRKRKVLLIDMDAQCNLTEGFDITVDPNKTVFQVLIPESPETDALSISEAVIAAPGRENLHILPGSPKMAYFDVAVSTFDHREYRLRLAMAGARGKYDYVLIDCPPGLGLVLLNSLFAADEVLVPVQTRQRRVNALPIFLKRLVQVQKHHPIRLTGIVPNQYDRRNSHDQQAYQYIEKFAAKHGFKLFPPIATTTRISESDSMRKPLCDYDDSTPAAEALRSLADEISGRKVA